MHSMHTRHAVSRFAMTLTALVAVTLLLASPSSAVPQKKGLLDELGLPMLSGAKLLDEVNIPPGKLLDDLAKEINGQLGMVELKQLSTLTLSTDKTPQEVFKFYEPSFADPQWKVLARAVDRDPEGDGIGLFFNEKKGLLIVVVSGSDSGDGEMTFVRMQGKIDTSKFGTSDKEMSDELRKMLGSTLPETGRLDMRVPPSRIPIGRPISVPPSEKLVIKATKSDIAAAILDQKTVEIRLTRKGVSDPGELFRVDDLIVLSLTPKLPVDEIDLPGAVPIAFELTDGSLTVTAGPKPADKPVRLSVVSTSAPVTLEGFPLLSGSHMVKIVDAEVNISFSKVQAGDMVISSTGDDVTITLPKDSSVKVDVDVVEGKIQKQIAAEMQKDDPDHIVFQLGDGKAQIAVHVVKGNVLIKSAE